MTPAPKQAGSQGLEGKRQQGIGKGQRRQPARSTGHVVELAEQGQRQPDGSYRGTADDVVGEAIGEVAGNALRWRYVLALPVDGKTYHVDFDDWMFLMDDKVMLNRSYMSKWGFNLGEVTLTFVKRQGQP